MVLHEHQKEGRKMYYLSFFDKKTFLTDKV